MAWKKSLGGYRKYGVGEIAIGKRWNSRLKKYDIGVTIYRGEGTLTGTARPISSKKFKTKAAALKYARAYMKTH